MQNKWIKGVSKAIFVAVGIWFLFEIGQLTFKENLHSEARAIKSYEVSQEDILSSGKDIVIKSFEDGLGRVAWVEDNALMIEGIVDGVDGVYAFDLNKKELTLYEETSHVDWQQLGYEVLVDIPQKGILAIKDKVLGLIQGDAFHVITENAVLDGEVRYVLSDDLSKLAYYHSKLKKIYVYAFDKDDFKAINHKLSDFSLKNFDQCVQLSPLGGYLTIESITEEIEKRNFYIYGADSGRRYAENVMGASPSWSPEDTYVAFYYTDASQYHADQLVSKRIGYYDVEKKKIDYIDSTNFDVYVFSKMYWHEGKLLAFTGDIQDDLFHLQDLMTYDFQDKKIQHLKVDYLLGHRVDVSFRIFKDQYVLINNLNDELVKVQIDNGEFRVERDLSLININDEEEGKYYLKDNALITLRDRVVSIQKDDYQSFVHIPNGQCVVYPAHDLTYVAIWMKSSNAIRIVDLN